MKFKLNNFFAFLYWFLRMLKGISRVTDLLFLNVIALTFSDFQISCTLLLITQMHIA